MLIQSELPNLRTKKSEYIMIKILTLTFLLSIGLFGGTHKTVKTIYDIYNELKTATKDIEFKNIIIKFDTSDVQKMKSNINIDYNVRFNNCSFTGHRQIIGINFNKGLYINSSKIGSLTFDSCRINKFHSENSKYTWFIIRNCVISLQGYNWSDYQEAFKSLPNDSVTFIFYNCQFNIGDRFSFYGSYEDINYFQFVECHFFSSTSSTPILSFKKNIWRIDHCIFDCDVSINDKVEIFTKNIFNRKIMINKPTDNMFITWKQLLHGYCVRNLHEDEINNYTLDTLTDEDDYLALINGYNTFYQYFIKRGDLESASGCYLKMKDAQNHRLVYLYRSNPNLQNYLNLKLTDFLGYFCDYGTNPIKAMLYALKVMLFFSLIFFIFPNQDDNIQIRRMIRKIHYYISYLTSNQKLIDPVLEKRNRINEELYKLKDIIAKDSKDIPSILRYTGLGLINIIRSYDKILILVMSKIEFSSECWHDLPRKKKIRAAIIINYLLIWQLLTGLIIRSLNAIAQSINFFITLGAGGLELKGINKYVAVVEGVIGWFLMCVFAVSLLNQFLRM